jgi:hypothetical protein
MAVPLHRVAIYAETPDEQLRLRKYAELRGWACWGRIYNAGEWEELIEDSRTEKFQYICAAFDDLIWIAATRNSPESERQRMLPRRAYKDPPKGALAITDLELLHLVSTWVNERGPMSNQDIAGMVFDQKLSWGDPGSVFRSVAFAMNRLPGFERDETGRWKKAKLRKTLRPPHKR